MGNPMEMFRLVSLSPTPTPVALLTSPIRLLVQGQLNQPVTSANFREDLIPDGRIKNADLNLVKTNKGHSIP